MNTTKIKSAKPRGSSILSGSLALIASGVVIMLASTEARAANISFSFAFGSQGTGNGQFNNPYSMSTDTAGNIYVADFSNNRVQKFNSSGNFISAFGTIGVNNG
jgi:DNA-binding beta-propeller fold protein YncE